MVNFREFKTTSGKIVLGGKSAKNNEDLVEQISPKEIVLHTAMPGSPFCNIKGDASKKDIKDLYYKVVFKTDHEKEDDFERRCFWLEK